MLKDIVEVKAIGGYRLWLRFENGVEGEIDCEPLISFTGVFAPLREVDYISLRFRSTPSWARFVGPTTPISTLSCCTRSSRNSRFQTTAPRTSPLVRAVDVRHASALSRSPANHSLTPSAGGGHEGADMELRYDKDEDILTIDQGHATSESTGSPF